MLSLCFIPQCVFECIMFNLFVAFNKIILGNFRVFRFFLLTVMHFINLAFICSFLVFMISFKESPKVVDKAYYGATRKQIKLNPS